MGAKLLLLLQIHYSIPSTHWTMTESGKIEAQPDSIFFMRQPHDFVAFLHQEQRHHDVNSLHDKLSLFRGQLDENNNLDLPDLESQLLKEDPDCVFAERPLTQFDLYVSTLVPIRALDMFEPLKMAGKPKMLIAVVLN
eukprot:TRINITY_DN40362_c0_g1_i1.p1 TRINITY_DN40362_c0_g1~~TRINITY_DN40362_c0_g1_i1.p1  ORF type:complete len:159 (-),score=16.43 TRINITY_DN40362_c0_g1_i1:6-419(-)